MQAPQIDAGNRADGTLFGHIAGEPVGRYAYAHAPLENREQAVAAEGERGKRGLDHVGRGPFEKTDKTSLDDVE